MSSSDKFSKNSPQVLGGDKTRLPTGPTPSGKPNPLVEAAKKAAERAATAATISSSKPPHFAIALDATGSMTDLILDAKKSLSEIIRRVTREAGQPIRIQLFAYRDYDMGPDVLIQSPLTGDANALVEWLGSVQATGGGGNNGEAIEAALSAIWQDGTFRCAIIAGDEPPNSRGYLDRINRKQALSALTLAEMFGRAKLPVHTFLVGGDDQTRRDFQAIATSSGGKAGRLDGSAVMIDMAVMAILASLKGVAAVRSYAEKNQLSAPARDFATLLLGSPQK